MQLDEQTPKTHTLKLENIGDSANGILCHVDNSRQAQDIDNQPKTWDDGTPRMTKIVYLHVNDGNGINSATGETAQHGDILAIFVEGGTFVEWKKAVDEYPAGLETGTLVNWVYVEDVKPQNPRHNARKRKAFTFSDPTAESRIIADNVHADLNVRLAAYKQHQAAETDSTPLDRLQASPRQNGAIGEVTYTEEPF
jgi:hypothetical protein